MWKYHGIIDETHVLIEQKSIDKDLRKPIKQSDGSFLTPYKQAKKYSDDLPYDKKPRWIVLCNFKSFLIHDMNIPREEPEEILLENLPKDYNRLSFLTDIKTENIKKEQELSVKAGESDLYDNVTMPIELRKAHEQNDIAVMKAYGFKLNMTESEIVAELMKMYKKLTERSKE